MKRKRKTAAEKRLEQYDAERRVWKRFRSRLESAQSWAEVILLAGERLPPPDRGGKAPGHEYYSNLNFFIRGLLEGFIVPSGSSYHEKLLYLPLIQRLDTAGELTKLGLIPDAIRKIEGELREAMAKQEPGHGVMPG
jgi:hypothetical protein